MKKFSFLLLCLFAAVGMNSMAQSVPRKAYNAGDKFTGRTVDGDTFTVCVLSPDAMTAQIGDGSGACMPSKAGKVVTIPSTVEGYTLTRAAAQSFYRFTCDSLSLPEGLTTIGEQAFMYAELKLGLPSTLTTLDNYAFRNSTIKKFVFPEGLLTVGRWVVYASKAESITIPSTVSMWGEESFANNGNLKEIIFTEGLKTIGTRCFSACTGLETLNLPKSVTSYGNYAFTKCTGLKTINWPENITALSPYMFQDCTGLEELTVPSSLTSIGTRAFAGCTGLKKIHFEEGIKQLGAYMFYGCNGLETISLPPFINYVQTSTDQHIFASCLGLKEVVFEEGCTKTGLQMFNGCTSLTDVYIPSTMTTFGGSSFYNCTNLKNVHFAEGLQAKNFSTSLFGNTGFEEFTYPEGMTGTGMTAFTGCTQLRTINLASTLTATDANTFQNCTNVTLVTAKRATPGTCNSSTFSAFASHATLMVPQGSLADYRAANGWKEFSNIEEQLDLKDGSTFQSITFEGDTVTAMVLNNEQKTCLIGNGTDPAPLSPINGKVTIPVKLNAYTVVGINANAFKGQTGITSVEMHEGITSIGDNAFEGCTGLTAVILPAAITTLGDNVYAGSTNIAEVTPKMETPIAINDAFFPENVYANALLYAPVGKKTAYQEADGWKQFAEVGENLAVGAKFDAPIEEGPNAYFEVVNADEHTCKVVNRGSNSLPSVSATFKGTVTIPAKVNGYRVIAIQDNAFYGHKNITKVVLPATVQSIGTSSFMNCSALEEINIPEGVTVINNAAFRNCTSLTFVKLPSTVTTIATRAFQTTALKRVILPESVTSIDTYAFSGCTHMTSLTSFGQPATIKTNTFSTYTTTVLHVEEGMTDTYKAAQFWSNFTNIDENASGTPITEELVPDEVLRNKMKELFGDKITDEDADRVTSLDLSRQGVKNLKGIELLRALQLLDISYNEIDSVDLTENTELTMLNAFSSKIKSLKVAGLVNLRILACYNNELEELDLTGLTSLEELYAGSNKLTQLGIPATTTLKIVDAQLNQLAQVGFGTNPALEQLNLSGNQLTAVSTGGFEALKVLNVANNLISTLGVTTNSALQTLNVANNKLTTLNVQANTNLEVLNVSDNSLGAINTTVLRQLREFNGSNNSFRALDFSNSAKLEAINLDGNSLTYVDLSACEKLTDADKVTLGTQTASGKGMYFVGLREVGAALHPYAKEESVENVVYGDNTIAKGKFNFVGTTPYIVFATDTEGIGFQGRTFNYQYNAQIPNLTAPRMTVNYIVGSVGTGIDELDNDQLTIDNSAWYTLDGKALPAQPVNKGIYIHNGKKVVVK